MMFRVSTINVPGTWNAQNQRHCVVVPGVPSVPCLCAHVRTYASLKSLSCTRTPDSFPRVYTRNTRNTLNKPVSMRISDVPCTRNTTIKTRNMEKNKPMRQAMPTVAAWIDELRDAFGAETINSAIKAGMEGQPTFYASENGHEIGTRAPYSAEKAVSLSDIILTRFSAAEAQANRSDRRKQ